MPKIRVFKTIWACMTLEISVAFVEDILAMYYCFQTTTKYYAYEKITCKNDFMQDGMYRFIIFNNTTILITVRLIRPGI